MPAMPSTLLVAGATGIIGRAIVAQAAAAGYRVRALSRDAARAEVLRAAGHEAFVADATVPGALDGSCEGIDIVISAMGASVHPRAAERRSYFDVDRTANLNLIEEARARGVRRFVYVSVFQADGYDHTSYIRAHEEVGAALRHSGLDFGLLRPTGAFSAFDPLLPAARRGFGIIIGSGSARTNPIHPDDVAAAALDLARSGEKERAVGGPEVLTRREIVELACRAAGRRARVFSVPTKATLMLGRAARRRSPRLCELIEFVTAVSVTNCVAPAVGTRRLADWFEARLRPTGAGRPVMGL